MKQALIVFVAQFLYIMLLGAQQLNVVSMNYPGAMAVSLCLGVLGFSLTAAIASVKGATWRSPVWWAFVAAGPLGIITAMATHG